MGILVASVLLHFILLLLAVVSNGHPLCTDLSAPFVLDKPSVFCPYSGKTCCNSTQDLELKKQFDAMSISEIDCASAVKSILCAKCDQFSADLFTIESVPRQVPILCNSTSTANSSRSFQETEDFCSGIWNKCWNSSITKSPFAPRANSSITRLTDLWRSKIDFCTAFGGSTIDGSVCFDGAPLKLTNNSQVPLSPRGLCLEKISNGSYLNMVAHPDGSSRAFFSDQVGKIWLATIPEEGSGGLLDLNESNPFLDLTDEVHFDTQFGLMGIAFHSDFARNGRFFASFNCDKGKWPGCGGRCSCNSDVNCDPSKLSSDNGAQPCQYQSVIAEYTANSTLSGSSSISSEVRRIFTMGLPFTSHHGGQILFGPDGYLYFMMGDGGGNGDPYNFAQNKKSLLGKIMRLDVDNIPSASEINRLSLWGNYSIPKDNPFVGNTEFQPEIWAYGFGNPWRCSFDSQRPAYFMCADVGQDTYEEVDMITKGGNYGWHIYEGPYIHSPLSPTRRKKSSNSENLIFPVMGYNHSEVNTNVGSASITGGYFYRSMTDPCTYGMYLYADLYAGGLWAGIETPEESGNFSTNKVPFSCAHDSPIQCTFVQGSASPALGYIFSFGEDNHKDIYILASRGVYRIIRPSRCNYACSKENITTSSPPKTNNAAATSYYSQFCTCKNLVIILSSLLLLFAIN